MNLPHVSAVFRKELRETLRDRRTLTVMFLFPLVVYPLVSLLMAEVMAGKQATDEARTSHVALVDPDPASRATLAALLERKGNGIEVTRDVSLAQATGLDVSNGLIDAVVEVAPEKAAAKAKAPGPLPVRIIYDETRPVSDQAHDRVTKALASVLPNGCFQSYAVTGASLATKTKVGGYVLSKILPLIVVIMTMLGAFYPAIDITAGERERGTLETLLSSPVQRFDLMTGKVLAVAALSLLTGVLNIVSMSLTVAEGARLAAGSPILAIPWPRAAATLLIVVPAAFLFGSVMVAIGAMARSFKEAQTLLMPVYLLCFTPSLVAGMADFRLTGLTMLVPGMNLTLLARDLMLGEAHLLATVIVMASTIGFGAVALAFAARLYDSERLLASTDADLVSLSAWLRHLVSRPAAPGSAQAAGAPPVPPSAGQAVALFGVAFVLWFFAFTWLQRWNLIPGLMISQWVGFLGLVWVYARLCRRPLGDVLVFRRPAPLALAGAACVGLSGWIILGILADKVMPPPREVVENIRNLIHPPGESRSLALSVFALAVTPAICEEALFRGAILQGLRRQFSLPVSCLLTGILFGVMHGDVWRFVPTTILGVLLSWVALTSGSIIPSMLVHVLNNGVLIVLGYYGLDQAGDNLSGRASVLILGAAVIFMLGGLAALRRAGRQTPAATGA